MKATAQDYERAAKRLRDKGKELQGQDQAATLKVAAEFEGLARMKAKRAAEAQPVQTSAPARTGSEP